MERQPGSAANLANSPTMSMMASNAGLVLGTAAYMSPEQAKGLPVDHRSDIFSFGIMASEMLTGRAPFHGETGPDVMASILARDPDLAGLAPDLNPRIAQLLGRCLEKNPKRRWQAIGDLRVELEAIALAPRAPAHAIAPPIGRAWWRRAIPIVVTALVAGALGAAVMRNLERPSVADVARFSISLPSGVQFTSRGRHTIALSPDGSRLVYNGLPGGLFVRALSDLEPTPI